MDSPGHLLQASLKINDRVEICMASLLHQSALTFAQALLTVRALPGLSMA